MSLRAEIHKKLGQFSLDIAFDTDRECMGILGASGCGKSMTLKCLAGIITPDSGYIELNGNVLYDSRKKINLTPQKRRVGYLFQNYALFPNMTVRQNIGAGMKNSREAKERVDALLRDFRLEEQAEQYPAQLSGGQQQRAALARILAYRPAVLMLDEPFSALDTYLKEQLQFVVQHAIEGYDGDVLMVTHSRDEVYRFCQSVVIMDHGRGIDSGRTRELFAEPGTLITAKLSGCKNFSRAKRIDEHHLIAEDWGVRLESAAPVPEDTAWVGIRAHDFLPVRPGGSSADASSAEEEQPSVSAKEGSTGSTLFHLKMHDLSEEPFEVSVRMIAAGNDEQDEDRYIWWKMDTPEWEHRYKGCVPEYFYVRPEKVMPLRTRVEGVQGNLYG